MSRSSAWLKLMISTREPRRQVAPPRPAPARNARVSTCAGTRGGEDPSRLSIQRTANGSVRQQRAPAPRPTWPPPNSATGARLRDQFALQRGASAAPMRSIATGAPRRRSTGPGWGRADSAARSSTGAPPASQARASCDRLELELAAADGAGQAVAPTPPSRCRPRAAPSPAVASTRTSTRVFARQPAAQVSVERHSCDPVRSRPDDVIRLRRSVVSSAPHGITAADEFSTTPAPPRPALRRPALPPCGSPAAAAPRAAAQAPVPRPAQQRRGRSRRHGRRASRAPPAPPPRATTARTPPATSTTLNKDRIYEGKLPPLLYAIGTLQVNLDASGKVRRMHWMRAPTHAPEVIAEIERTVLRRRALPRRHARWARWPGPTPGCGTRAAASSSTR